uniref:Uncharacterized protein n=1 Tax=Romanomermis culicivorax TaxID=13658 RepID=A0A915JUH0_ROMCU
MLSRLTVCRPYPYGLDYLPSSAAGTPTLNAWSTKESLNSSDAAVPSNNRKVAWINPKSNR